MHKYILCVNAALHEKETELVAKNTELQAVQAAKTQTIRVYCNRLNFETSDFVVAIQPV